MAAAALKRLPLRTGRPTAQEVRSVIEVLSAQHGRPNRHQHSAGLQPGCELKEPHSVLDSLIRTILSQNTTDITSQRAYTSLKQAFPSWELVRTAPPGAVEDAIRVGGLADIKAGRIKAILESLLVERGELSLEHLRQLPGDEVKAQLTKYKGVGPKSIACVMLFCLGRAECPVDTHVWEISKQLGWVPDSASREATYEYLNRVVPDDHKYELHVLLVEHGKVCPACFKRSKAGNKRKGIAAAAPPCPLAPFKQRSSSKLSSSKATTPSKASSSCGSSLAAAGGPVSEAQEVVVKAEPGAAVATGVVIKTEQDGGGAAAAGVAVAVKLEQVEQHSPAGTAALTLKQEPAAAAAAEQAGTPQKQQSAAKTRKRTRRA